MEPFLTDFLTNKKVPKILRYALLAAVTLFLEYVFIQIGIHSPFVWGKVFGWVFAAGMLAVSTFLAITKIHKN